MTGTLFLVPNLLGAVPPATVLPARTIEIARNLVALARRDAETRARVPEIDRRRASGRRARDPRAVRRSPGRRAVRARRACQRPRCGLVVRRRLSRRGRSGRCDRRGRARCARARRAAGGSVGRAARADGVRHERPAVRVPRLSAGKARCAKRSAAHARAALARRSRAPSSSSRRRIAMSRCWARLPARCNATTRVCVAADLTLDTETIECRTAPMARRTSALRPAPAIFLLQASDEEFGHGVAGPGGRCARPGYGVASSSGQSLM